MRIIDLAVALTIFIGSACVTALLTVLLIHYGLGVPSGSTEAQCSHLGWRP